jgi:hypothetical protein
MLAIALIRMLVLQTRWLWLYLGSTSCLLAYRLKLLLLELLGSLRRVDNLHGRAVWQRLATLMLRSQLLLGLVINAGRWLLGQVHADRCLSVNFDCAASHADIRGSH